MKKISDIKRQNQGLISRGLDALIANSIKKNKEFVLSNPDYKLGFFQSAQLIYYIFLLKRSWPLAYILNKKEFFNLDFSVNKNTLVPRPETELMVELAIEKARGILKDEGEKIALIDIGTGSGCVIASILKSIDNKSCRDGKRIQAIATDISSRALKVAKKNARAHHLKIKFIKCDLLDHNFLKNMQERDIILTANLPYLTAEQANNEPSIEREPKKALIGGKNGLELYEKLIKQISELRAKADWKNEKVTCFFEINPSQSELMSRIINSVLMKANTTVYKDLSELDRIIEVVI
ncbi:MAG: HemK family protein methyltransferase [bacterium]